jgi:hypothetical protein
MLVCQPRKPVVMLIAACLCSCFLLACIWFYQLIRSPAPSLLSLFAACLLFAVLLFVTIRLSVGYISLQAGNNRLTVKYTILGKSKTYDLASVTAVEEIKIKTFQNKEFRQLLVTFGQEKISFNNQVYSGYDAMKHYLNQRKPGRRKQ